MDKIIALRMERQFLTHPAGEADYRLLYRDMQPGQNVYWNGFGQPPTLSFRADFDDLAWNRARQANRDLVKGRFAGGNLGWVEDTEMELFACLYRKPLEEMTFLQSRVLELIQGAGPLTIQQIKEETGLLVKEITPILHRLQEAFLVYEDQYDGEWERGWYRFEEMFPQVQLDRYTRREALKIVLPRFAFRQVWMDGEMVKAFYKLPAKEIKGALAELTASQVLVEAEGGYLLAADQALLEGYQPAPLHFVYAVHRNDFLYKSLEHLLKKCTAQWLTQAGEADWDREPLQYLLIDGTFHGAVLGHFRNGPYDLNDVVCDLPEAEMRKEEILAAIADVNGGRRPARWQGKKL